MQNFLGLFLFNLTCFRAILRMGVASLLRGALKLLVLRPAVLLSPEEGGGRTADLDMDAFLLPNMGFVKAPLPAVVAGTGQSCT